MSWIKEQLRNKIIRRVVYALITLAAGALGFSEVLQEQLASEGSNLVIERIAE